MKFLYILFYLAQQVNLSVARAIFNFDLKTKYYVVGQGKLHKDIIEKYPNVILYDYLSKNAVYKIMQTSSIYIENSSCHVFGIDAIEALYLGCNVLVSQRVEALELFTNLTEDDLIYDISNSREIERKLQILKKGGNNKRLCAGIKWDEITMENQIKKLKQVISG